MILETNSYRIICKRSIFLLLLSLDYTAVLMHMYIQQSNYANNQQYSLYANIVIYPFHSANNLQVYLVLTGSKNWGYTINFLYSTTTDHFQCSSC